MAYQNEINESTLFTLNEVKFINIRVYNIEYRI